ncbi:MAG: UPF0175 family protein [Promethearchaeota archaeon]
MSERLSIVIPFELNKEIEKLQEILKMDKSTTIRHLFLKSIEEIKIETALDEYKKEKVSFGKASEIAGVNLWEFIDIFNQKKIGLNLTKEEVDLSINRILKMDLIKIQAR